MKSYDLKAVTASGSTILSFFDAMTSFQTFAENLVQESRFGEEDSSGKYVIKKDNWYSIEQYLAFHERVKEKVGPRTLINVGKKIIENAVFPEDMDSIEKGLHSINIAYHMNHSLKGTVMFDPATGKMLSGIGFYKFEPSPDAKEGILICENPYSSELDEGIIIGVAKKFVTTASVSLDTSKPTRRNGADSCTFIVKW